MMRVESKFGWVEFDGKAFRWAYNLGQLVNPQQSKPQLITGFLMKRVTNLIPQQGSVNSFPIEAIFDVEIGRLEGDPIEAPGAILFKFARNGQLVQSALHIDVENLEQAIQFVELVDQVLKDIHSTPETEKSCPMCAETIKIEAKKCRFCGELLD